VSYHDIHAAEVGELLQKEGVVVIDVRDAQAQSKGQLPNALPPSDAVINGLVRQRRSNPPVLVYCYHGNSSRDLCGFLSQLGLSQVYNLVGGWEAWENWQQLQPAAETSAPELSFNEAHMDWLQSHGFDPQDLNSRADLGMTSLMMAALRGNHDLVDTLLTMGADTKAVNDDEHHALWFACVHGDVALVEKLISHGSNVNNRNINGVTSAMYAASTGKLDVLKTLVNAGADLSICTPDGIDALQSSSTVEVLRYLKSLVREAV
jgi:rhodanese-related sulfurtransferase